MPALKGPASEGRAQAWTAALFVALAAVHTWPMATAPGTFTRHDNADTYLNQWILAWVAHILPRNPLELFNANIFYPEPDTLAYSEHLVVQGVMGAPLAWLGASPVLAHNLVLLAGLALTAWATAFVVSRWTGDALAGALAGSVAAFNTHTMSRMAHLQAMHVEFLPLALFALDRVLERPRVRDALALAGWSALQMLCSGYLLVFTAVTLVASVLARVREWVAGPRARRTTALLVLAAAGAVLLCLPFLVPYARVHARQGFSRSLEEAARYSVTAQCYLSTVGDLHYRWWSHRVYAGADPLFPGVVPLGLALVAVGTGLAWRDRRARMLLGAGLAGGALSFGPAFPPYTWLYYALPILQGIRGPARFGYVVILAVGVLAGFGLAHLRRAHGKPKRRARLATWGAVIAIILVNAEAFTTHEFTRFNRLPPLYDLLAADPDAVVLEWPLWPPESVHFNGAAVFASTSHWRPLVNGYSGFTPQSYRDHFEALQSLPDDTSLAELRRLGVTHVVVSQDRAPEIAEALETHKAFRLIGAAPGLRLYRLAGAVVAR